jgi:hypothetical protein
MYDEFQELHDPDKQKYPPEADVSNDQLIKALHEVYPRTALCLSGGGIRSAAFGLGILEWLAQARLLNGFQYLSTVSGGGYIGSWLSAWIARDPNGYAAIERKLSPSDRLGKEPAEIQHLRKNTKYITQKSGLISGDTWAAVAISIRNVLLNWLVIVPFVCSTALIPQIMVSFIACMSWYYLNPLLIIALFLISYFVYAFNSTRNLPRWTVQNISRTEFNIHCMLPFVASSLMWTCCIASWHDLINGAELYYVYISSFLVISLLSWGANLIYWDFAHSRPWVSVRGVRDESQLAAECLTYEITLSRPAKRNVSINLFTEDRQAVATKHYKDLNFQVIIPAGHTRHKLEVPLLRSDIEGVPIDVNDVRIIIKNVDGADIGKAPSLSRRIKEIGSIITTSLSLGIMAAAAHSLLYEHFLKEKNFQGVMFLTISGVPIFCLINFLAQTIFVGITSKKSRSEEDREWLGRLSGLILGFAAAWLVVFLIVLLTPEIPFQYVLGEWIDKKVSLVMSAIAALSGIVTALIGRSANTPAFGKTRSKYVSIAMNMLTVLFIITFVSELVFVADIYAINHRLSTALDQSIIDETTHFLAFKLTILSATLFIFGSISAWFVNVNRFSLHSMYRNRLVRAFLGASTDPSGKGTVNKFTEFGESDNLELQRLWERTCRRPTGASWRPYHVINMTLNATSRSSLARQERKAASFIASPLWCGSGSPELDAFRRTSEYGGTSRTITLGTAMAISGAAVSPNMGYNSSPFLAIILTLFNLRLGWWFGNPANDETYRLEGPRLGIRSILEESLGLTSFDTPYVYLSDGGHFENLGLYEMVRRRCHYIFISDAGHDPNCQFEDLANAARKIAIDFGIKIDFPFVSKIRPRKIDLSASEQESVGFAIGTIDYKSVDGDTAHQGLIIYLKPGIRGDEPIDVLGYANKNSKFPHDDTADQWFTEDQFESYRSLAFASMGKLMDVANIHAAKIAETSGEPRRSVQSVAELFKALRADLRDRGI